jgi:hypothetical protein
MRPYSLLQQGELVVYEKLENNSQVHYQEISRFRKHDFRTVVCCGVLLESFPGPAAREASFEVLLKQDDGLPFWSVAIEDLFACEDLFDSPTKFLHFLQWRTRPDRSLALASEELDYVISYFREMECHENSPRPAPKQGCIPWHVGGTAAIARMYWAEDRERQKRSASQSTELLAGLTETGRNDGSLYLDVQRFLDTTNRPGRARVAATFYDLRGPARERLIKGLDHASAVAADGRGTILASGTISVLVIATPESKPMLNIEVRTRGLRFLKVLGSPEATVIVLTLSKTGRLGNMRWQFLKAGELI